MKMKKLITSESVGKGHPDKICDQISDHILDQCLKRDVHSRVACEVFASNRLIIIGGEITTTAYVDVVTSAWDILLPLGYDENDFTIISNVNKQSSDIAQAIKLKDNHVGAGDQGIVFGYATNETSNYMPLSITLAHELVKKIENARVNKLASWIRSDMKSQVTIDVSNDQPTIDNMLVSVQHEEKAKHQDIEKFVGSIMDEVAKAYNLNTNFKKIINPSKKFIIGGPIGDTGLTGRKIIIDTYGGVSRHGGGAFSGKDPTKVDRSGAYYARYIAKNVVAAGLADKFEIQLSYAIGISKPIAIYFETFNTNKVSEEKIYQAIIETFNFEIDFMIKHLKLNHPIYLKTAVFGHFGRNEIEFEWEKLNQVKNLKKYLA